MSNKNLDDQILHELFVAARTENTVVCSNDLMTALYEDAKKYNPKCQKTIPPKTKIAPNWFDRIRIFFGGGVAIVAFASCAFFGLYLGYFSSAPQYLGLIQENFVENYTAYSDIFTSTETYNLMISEEF